MPRHDESSPERLLKRDVDAWNPARLERNLTVLHRRLRRRRVVRATVGVLAVVAVGVALTWRANPRAHAPLRLEDGSVIASREGAQFHVAEQTPRLVRVDLETGYIDVDVAPNPERTFIVGAGEVEVVVVGTRFEVTREDRAVSVRVLRGRVRVRSATGEALAELAPGDERHFEQSPSSTAPFAPAAVPLTPTRKAQGPRATNGPSTPTSPQPGPSTMEPGEWRSLAQRGVYDEAYVLLAKEGATGVRDEVDDLLLAADAARLSRHPTEALTYLERIVTGHAQDGRAPMAAFTRGRLLTELGHDATAGESFEAAVSLGAEGSLSENALARAVEAHARAGNRARATALARHYLERYPSGRWTAMVRTAGGLSE